MVVEKLQLVKGTAFGLSYVNIESSIDYRRWANGLSPMPRLTDPLSIKLYLDVLGNFRTEGYVNFSKDAALWLSTEMPGWTQRGFAKALFQFVRGGGEIDRVEETRWNWSDKYAYHYDLRPTLKGRRCRLYVETRLVPDHPKSTDNPYILVANIHDA